jgi:hypothetical protein
VKWARNPVKTLQELASSCCVSTDKWSFIQSNSDNHMWARNQEGIVVSELRLGPIHTCLVDPQEASLTLQEAQQVWSKKSTAQFNQHGSMQ